LRLVGKAGESRGRSATATSTIYDQAGNILAEAEALLINVPDQVVQNVDLAQLGWQIYPED
jgi:hypothetical protein